MRKVEVVPYNHTWPQMFTEEASKIENIMTENIEQIYHIGSTSIPGLFAKPIIDILVEVKSIEKVDSYNQEMLEIGYDPKGENGIPNRRYFSKGGDNRTHHIHIFQSGNHEIMRHLLFRDYLIFHPEKAREYGKLKLSLAKQFPANIDQYIEGKDALVKELDREAEQWNRERKIE